MVATVSVLGLIVTLVFGREDTEQHVMRDFLGLPSPALAAMNESVTPLLSVRPRQASSLGGIIPSISR